MQLNSLKSSVLALVDKTIQYPRAGRIYLYGSWWPAISNTGAVISEGHYVRVVGTAGIALIVEPIDSTECSA